MFISAYEYLGTFLYVSAYTSAYVCVHLLRIPGIYIMQTHHVLTLVLTSVGQCAEEAELFSSSGELCHTFISFCVSGG
eukprot:COSAG06_NODE_7076_length_2644_cov_1.548527_1_plen_78_part_00